MSCGGSQGSILGPTLFNNSRLAPGDVFGRLIISFCNTQFHIAVSPDDLQSTTFMTVLYFSLQLAKKNTFFNISNKVKTEIFMTSPVH